MVLSLGQGPGQSVDLARLLDGIHSPGPCIHVRFRLPYSALSCPGASIGDGRHSFAGSGG